MRKQLLGYACTAGLAALVDIGGFHLLAPRLGGVLLPAAASFGAAAVVNYLLSSTLVFRADWRSWRRAAMFLAAALVGLCVNAGMTWLLATAAGWPPTLAKVGGVGTAFGVNFLLNARLVFGRRPRSERGNPFAPSPSKDPRQPLREGFDKPSPNGVQLSRPCDGACAAGPAAAGRTARRAAAAGPPPRWPWARE